MLRLIYGKAGTGKTAYINGEIKKYVDEGQGNIIMLVPDQYSHECEREMCRICGNTMSRFVKVTGFKYLTRLLSSEIGGMNKEYMDNAGRLLCMALSAKNSDGYLQSFTDAPRSPEVQNSLLLAVDEMKNACITPLMLRQSLPRLSGELAKKIEDLALILESYDAIIANGKMDPSDKLSFLAKRIEETSYGRGKKIYADGFSSFSVSELQVIGAFLKSGADVTVCLTLDAITDGDEKFTIPRMTAMELASFANRNGIEVAGDVKIDEKGKAKESVIRCGGILEECEMAALRCLRLVRSTNCRFRDIAIAVRNFEDYRAVLESTFHKYNVPLFVTERNNISSKPLPSMISSAYDIVLGGWESDDVISFIGTGLVPVDEDEADILTKNLSCRYILEREKFAFLKSFEKAVKKADTAHAHVLALLKLLEDMGLEKTFREKGSEMPEYLQMWDLVVSALEQFDSVLGNSSMDADEFSRLVKLMLSKYDIGLIPVSLDSVSAGDFDRMRRRNIRHLIILGANEDRLPGACDESGIFTSDERQQLADVGIVHGIDAEGRLWRESLLIYNTLTLASDTVLYSVSGEKSIYVPEIEDKDIEIFSYENAVETLKDVLRISEPQKMENLEVRATALRGSLSDKSVEALYGKNIKISASQADSFYSCRYRYFCQYGLNAKPWEREELTSAEIGTFVHYVLENVVQGKESVHDCIKRYVKEELDEFKDKNARYIYLFKRLEGDVEKIAADTLKEIERSRFRPVSFETNTEGAGIADRMDVWEKDDKKYLRIADYKTGNKKFDLNDIYNGLNMQMLMYLDTICKKDEEYIPSGVMYVPAKNTYISAERNLTDEELEEKKEKNLRRSGIMLSEDGVPEAWESGDDKTYTPSGKPVSKQQMDMLFKHVSGKMENMKKCISEGSIEANPYFVGESENACTYCNYKDGCAFKDGEKGESKRQLEKLSDDEVWATIGGELKNE